MKIETPEDHAEPPHHETAAHDHQIRHPQPPTADATLTTTKPTPWTPAHDTRGPAPPPP